MTDKPPVSQSHNFSAATFNAFDAVRKVYEETFWPGTKRLAKPSRFEQLLQAHATRGRGFMKSIDVLAGPAHFQSMIAAIRTLFEIAVDVELLCNCDQLIEGGDAAREVVQRHELMWKCQKLKRGLAYVNHPLTPKLVAELARPRLPEIKARLDAQALKVFAQKEARKVSHWFMPQLSRRVKKVDELIGGARFASWYDVEYEIASIYVHGTLGNGTADTSVDELHDASAVIFGWGIQFVPDHIMRPVWTRMKLHQADPEGWRTILGVQDAADLRMRDFLQRSDEIWKEHHRTTKK